MPGSLPGIDDGGGEIAFHFGQAFTLREAAGRLGISLRQVEMHVADGSLGAINVGRGRLRRDLRILDEELERFVTARKVAPISFAKAPKPHGRHRHPPMESRAGSFAEKYLNRAIKRTK